MVICKDSEERMARKEVKDGEYRKEMMARKGRTSL